MTLLAAQNLRKTYRLGKVDVRVLKGVSLDVAAGEWVSVLGASGSGKSTLLHLLGALDHPDKPALVCSKCGYSFRGLEADTPCPECAASFTDKPVRGDVLFQGKELTKFSGRELNHYRRATVGFVFQFYHLLPELNVLENVLLAAMVLHGRFGYLRERSRLRDEAIAILTRVGLGERLKHRPVELSGGERQRVAIARALVNKPQVLLADEPTGNLDRKTGGTILELLSELHREGQTMVVVTHDAENARRADRIVRIVDGKIFDGPDVEKV